MPNKYERFVGAYLRLNGYFQVPSFIVHAADPTRTSGGVVGNYTECDSLAIRLPHSEEIVGVKHVANHQALLDGAGGKIDVIVAEAKSGNENRPNTVWRAAATADPIASYIVRFVGTHPAPEVGAVAATLASTFRSEDTTTRYRYIVFSIQANKHYADRGITYITYREAIRFVVAVRGDSWLQSGLGVRSAHNQWDDMLIDIFRIANDQARDIEQRIADIESFLAAP